jgi:hypothetical protein
MPAEQLVATSISIANDLKPVAILWHLVLGGVLIAAIGGWRPSRRTCDLLLCAPLASVAAVAVAFGNPIDAAVIGALTISLAMLGWRAGRAPIEPGTDASDFAGGAILMVAAAYPAFVGVSSPLEYLYSAPIGLLAAPTLLLVTGLALFTGDHGGRTWARVLVAADVAYGLYGLLFLGVWVDATLLVAGGVLMATTIHADEELPEAMAVVAPVTDAMAALR